LQLHDSSTGTVDYASPEKSYPGSFAGLMKPGPVNTYFAHGCCAKNARARREAQGHSRPMSKLCTAPAWGLFRDPL